MSNHYHLLLETPSGNLSQIMRHINGAYTTYFNVKRKRAGHLFQGRYKTIIVEADAYALKLSRYMHLNPVRAGMVAKPEHTLNGRGFKKLEVGLGSLGYARMQMRASQTIEVAYDVYGDGVSRSSPEIPF
jgi:hypothetical protein